MSLQDINEQLSKFNELSLKLEMGRQTLEELATFLRSDSLDSSVKALLVEKLAMEVPRFISSFEIFTAELSPSEAP
jgi:hypothetical protein